MPSSRACLACRSKRRSCDRELPSCGRCMKGGTPCPGYSEGPLLVIGLDQSNFTSTTARRQRHIATKHHQTPSYDLVKLTPRPITSFDAILYRDTKLLEHGTLRYNALNALHFATSDFVAIYEALWNSFCSGYCLTQDYWPKGLSRLALRHGTLDLALLALSAKRMSFTGNPELHRLSVEAYGQSLSRFRSHIEGSKSTRIYAPLVCISLIFTLIEGGSLSMDKLLQHENLAFEHIDGALAFMRYCEPESFAQPGLHETFQKIRELSLITLLVRRQTSILGEPRWLRGPWSQITKTTRDQLYDIAVRLANLRSPDRLQSSTVEFLNLDGELLEWQSGLEAAKPGCRQHTCRRNCFPRSCICFDSTNMTDPHTVLISTEARSLQLLIDLEIIRRETSSLFDTPMRLGPALNRVELNARVIRASLSLPLFRQTEERPEIMTEGRCRSVLPNLALQACQETLETYALVAST